MAPHYIKHLTLTPNDPDRLANLCGQMNDNLVLLEHYLGVEINSRGNDFEILGIPLSVDKACDLIQELYQSTEEKQKNKEYLTEQDIQLALKSIDMKTILKNPAKDKINHSSESCFKLAKAVIQARTDNQAHYVRALKKYDINFGIGPSGTGKTFLAVASALEALEQETISRIVLTRPAVEAGENLGFLPGDLAQKIDPYLRPLYDALYEMLGLETTTRYIDKGIIEIAPLAYMRGRTLHDSFVILDEGQNTTKEQMKMLLTRIGFRSKAIITGDITQVDLPKKMECGLRHATSVLHNIDQVHFTFFNAADVVRHPVVQKIIEAYEDYEA